MEFIQTLINGLTLGSIYGLIAIGYTMVFGIIGMVNFAHGDVFMLSAFIALILFLVLTQLLGVTSVPLAFVIVLVAAMALTALWNWTIERIAYRPLRGSFRLAPLISAIGMSIVPAELRADSSRGPANVKPMPPTDRRQGFRFSARAAASTVRSSYKQIFDHRDRRLVLMTGFSLLISRTALGRASARLRAGHEDGGHCSASTSTAPSRLTFVMGAALAAVAGVLYLSYYGVVDFSDRLPAGRQSLHRGGPGRHRLAARGGAGRPV